MSKVGFWRRGDMTDSLRSHVGIGSESHCLLGQLNKILEISDSEAGLKVEKSGGVITSCYN